MNGRERMACAMARGRPDRVPVMCQLALGHHFLHGGRDPLDVWLDSDAFADVLVVLARRYGFDGVLVNLPGREPGWREHAARVDEAGDERHVVWRSGRRSEFPPDDNPRVVGPDGGPLTRRADAVDPGALRYVEPHGREGLELVTGAFPPWQAATLRAVRERLGAELSLHGEVFSPLTQWLELVGYQDGLLALALDPDRTQACLDRLAGGAAELAVLQADAGCDAVLVSSAFAGAGFVSRAHYARFELPFVQRIVAAVRAAHAGVPVYLHTCGAIGDRLDLMVATGVDGIDTLDPPPIGTVELAAALRVLDGRVFVKGNLDPVHTLLEGDVDAVRAAARERLALAGPRGGYVLSSACSVAPHTPPENLMVLREEAERFANG